MPSLKDLRNRIASVKATQKITKAMQMVAAAKLRRAQEAAEAARPYRPSARARTRRTSWWWRLPSVVCVAASTARSRVLPAITPAG
jgi:hypothetical protein